MTYNYINAEDDDLSKDNEYDLTEITDLNGNNDNDNDIKNNVDLSTTQCLNMIMQQNFMTMKLMTKMCGLLEEIKSIPQQPTTNINSNITKIAKVIPVDDEIIYYHMGYSLFKFLKKKYENNSVISYTRFLFNTYGYISNIMVRSTKSTKYDWLLTDGIFSQYTSPFYIDRGHNIFYIKDPDGKSLIKDVDGYEFDRIGNNIIINSLLECHGEIIKNIPENGDEARFNPLYDMGCMNMYNDIANYKKLIVSYNYLFKLVCKIDDKINANKYETYYTSDP